MNFSIKKQNYLRVHLTWLLLLFSLSLSIEELLKKIILIFIWKLIFNSTSFFVVPLKEVALDQLFIKVLLTNKNTFIKLIKCVQSSFWVSQAPFDFQKSWQMGSKSDELILFLFFSFLFSGEKYGLTSNFAERRSFNFQLLSDVTICLAN